MSSHYTRTVSQPAELLSFLFEAWPETKKKQIRMWLKRRSVTVNGRVTSQFDQPLKRGDKVEIRTDGFAPPDTKLAGGMRIRYEDAALLVIEKPAGLLTIANEKVRDNTAYFRLNEYLRGGNRYSRERVWIVHRLDKDTSGLMLFAKTEEAKRTLQGNWDDFQKKYLAIVEGMLPEPFGTWESYLDEEDPARVRIVRSGREGRLAITHYRVLKTLGPNSLVELTLETGRRHQIRVHLAATGCPIVGDGKYGAKTNPFRRVALHASALKFRHPETGATLKFDSPLPGELTTKAIFSPTSSRRKGGKQSADSED